MNAMDERMDTFERQLNSVSTDVQGLRGEVGELRGEVGELRGEVGEHRSEVGELRSEVGELRGEVGELRGDVHSLRIIVESHDSHIKLIAEVQAHHGTRLEEHGRLLREIKDDLRPLGDLRDFVTRIADDHEGRLRALEGARDPKSLK
jgi:archaellum component FlaC